MSTRAARQKCGAARAGPHRQKRAVLHRLADADLGDAQPGVLGAAPVEGLRAQRRAPRISALWLGLTRRCVAGAPPAAAPPHARRTGSAEYASSGSVLALPRPAAKAGAVGDNAAAAGAAARDSASRRLSCSGVEGASAASPSAAARTRSAARRRGAARCGKQDMAERRDAATAASGAPSAAAAVCCMAHARARTGGSSGCAHVASIACASYIVVVMNPRRARQQDRIAARDIL